MIKFKIIKSPDFDHLHREFVTTRMFFSLGRSLECDLIIDDKKILKEHLLFFDTKKGLVIKSTSQNAFFLSNGKKMSGVKSHKVNDTFQVGETLIKITEYESKADKNNALAEELREKYEKLIEEDSESKNFIQSLEQEMLDLQSINNEDG